METLKRVRVVEVSPIAASYNSPESATELLLPLTYFDIIWLRFNPSERVYYYRPADSTPDFFYTVVVPKLKHSLSLALSHFPPLAGRLTWPSNAPKPAIHYTLSDTVSLTIAESDADFDRLSSKITREAIESICVIPELPISKSETSIFSLQITLFPNSGFSIGYSAHHAILDGKSITMFMKLWAHICRENQSLVIPKEFKPSFDRTVIKDSKELDLLYLKNWEFLGKTVAPDQDPRTLELIPGKFVPKTNLIRATFELTREDLAKLRSYVELQEGSNTIQLSTFVLVYSYVVVCLVKSKGEENVKLVHFGFVADCRTRLDSIPENYFGNCVSVNDGFAESKDLIGDNGIVFMAKKVSEVVQNVDKSASEGSKDLFEILKPRDPKTMAIGIAGSPRFQLYRVDFGFGRPIKVEVTSINKNGGISIEGNGDENGGIEIGLVLEMHQIDKFTSFFLNGLQQF